MPPKEPGLQCLIKGRHIAGCLQQPFPIKPLPENLPRVEVVQDPAKDEKTCSVEWPRLAHVFFNFSLNSPTNNS